MLRLEPRRRPSKLMLGLTPVLAVIATMIAGGILFAILGKNPVEAIRIIFIDPFLDPFSRTELLVKGAPLVLIAIGLSLGFRANIWNIGAEGQFVIGALAGGATGLAFYPMEGIWILPVMAIAGAAGGFAWAMIPAFLKIRFNANEILVSLMLVYVAILLLSALVSGPLRDPDGFNFPESRLFHDSATLPIIISGSRAHAGVLVALASVVIAYVLLNRHVLGYQIKLTGQAPKAAAFAGVNANRIIAICLGTSGALAGLAGMFEAAGPVGQLVPALPVGYGFTAIIVAFLGRLNPIGILLAGGVMALTYIGGETAQLTLSLPAAAISVFQGMLLFFLLAMDILITYRVRIRRTEVA
ncbi:ABC transporter permease [Oceanomicrobium pacificus]|uniref:ABC transporter permease n=1 Tax=Oceanomicrobium pacificus TaxID=2692916 RepID=A0A6B0U2Q9_9RHOB|nr:ABC transporter permease [Oceanomicrobium pacificus]MXU65281.1 ABC transporter permease [Oceanomicrobium pacificus]